MLESCSRTPPPRGVVLVVVDTLRADHMSLYGYDRDTTPHLREWAESGSVYDQAVATSSWTLPTFGSIHTGHWPTGHRAGQRIPKAPWWKRNALAESLATLAEILRDSGFATGAVVNNDFLKPHLGMGRGFQHYDVAARGGPSARSAGTSVDLALAWFDANRPDAFFFELHLLDPHLPYRAPPPFQGRFTAGLADSVSRPIGSAKKIRRKLADLSAADRAFITAAYDEEIAYTDEQIHRFFEGLAERGFWQRSLVIVTADHGEELFDHGGFEHGHTMYQELLRIPLMFWGPSVKPRRESRPVSVIDLLPTVLEAVGAEARLGLPGVSLWGNLTKGRRLPRRSLIAEGTLYGGERKALVRLPWKLVLNERFQTTVLFNLEQDPGETVDLSAEEPEIAERLLSELRTELASYEIAAPTAANDASTTQEDLRALGYLQ